MNTQEAHSTTHTRIILSSRSYL